MVIVTQEAINDIGTFYGNVAKRYPNTWDEVKQIREMIDNIHEMEKKSKHEENIIEYKYIPHDLTNLPFDIYIDDGNSYINHKHPLWLYILKNDNLIPITIESEPKVIEGVITKSEYISITEFICTYLKLLQDIADDLVDSSVLNNKLQQYRMVSEAVEKVINEGCHDEAPANIHTEPLFEMAHINVRESGSGLFPYNKWELKVWSNDHTPPHFHVIADGWDVSFKIDSGELLVVNRKGRNVTIYQYMITNIPKWLEAPAAIMPKITNRENAQLQWEQFHS